MKKLTSIIEKIEPIDKELMEKAQNRLDSLTKPQGSLGRLEELAKKAVGITRQRFLSFDKKVIVTIGRSR